MKVIVCGSRELSDYLLLKRKLDKILSKLDKKRLVICHGGAKGADALADRWGRERMVTRMIWHPDWGRHGKSAGIIRNAEMLQESKAKVVIAFWDGKSPGTKDMIAKARKSAVTVRVIMYKGK